MICPRCKTELPDNTIRCPKCLMKVNIVCPDCKTINPIGVTHCRNCSKELIKICPACKSFNLPDALECRKCHTAFEPSEELSEDNLSSSAESNIVKPFSSTDNNFNLPNITANAQPIEMVQNSDENNDDIEKDIFHVDEVEAINIETVQYEENYEQIAEEQNNKNPDINIDIESAEDVVIGVNKSLLDETEKEPEKNETTVESEQEEYNLENIEIQPDAVNKTVNLIRSSINKHIIAINGLEGSGKSAVLKQVKNYLADNDYICLYGSMTPLLQITSFGFFQDAFLRIMGFPPFIKSSDAFVRDFKKSKYAGIFHCLDNNELSLFLNIFYPNKEDDFENILENKKVIFSILEKLITSLLLNSNIVIAIDNFELLDGASYDFIVHLMKKGYFNNRLKLLAAYQENKSIQSYFDLPESEEGIFETLIIKKFNKEDLLKSVKRTTGIAIEDILDSAYTDELIIKSDGNAIRMEQEAAFLFDINYITVEDESIVLKKENKPEITPESFEELIKLRLNVLAPVSKNMLFMAAVMGYRFSGTILFASLNIPPEKGEKMLDYLVKELYIDRVDNYTCEFKSLSLWKIIYNEAKSDSLYKENSQRLYSVLKPLILSSNLQKVIACVDAIDKNDEFIIWQQTASLTAKLGDTNIYIIALKQCLKLIDELNPDNADDIRIIIYEQMGKLLCEKSPKEAISYLSNVLDISIKNSEIRKIVDISGYFIKSCYLSGNYFGVTEAVDTIISSLTGANQDISGLNLSLIKTRKLNALLNIGNSEQIINLVNEEIIPDLEQEIEKKIAAGTNIGSILINAWLLSKVSLAKAYAIQGNKEIFKVIKQLREFIPKHNYNTEYYSTQTDIMESFAYTISGQINKSEEILRNIMTAYNTKNMDTSLLAEWNLINVINRVLSDTTDGLKNDLFELAAYTNNINEHSLKNIVKLILGYILKEEGNKAKALEIFNEEITYFAKEKVAIGAMLSWALIVQITMDMGDYDKALNTASKSLEIAQSPKINNYFFSIYFQKYIAEIYLIKQDYVAAKMYFEKAIMMAKQYDLKYQLVELYTLFGKYMEEFMQANNLYTTEHIKLTSEMFNKAILIAKELGMKNLLDLALKARASFKVYCQLNSIELVN